MDRDPILDKAWRVVEASGASAIDNTGLDLKVASILQGDRHSQRNLFSRLQSSVWTKLEDFWDMAKLYPLVLQPPRLKSAQGIPDHAGRHYVASKTSKLHSLCSSCQRVFQSPGLISGSRFWLTRTVETHTLHTALYGLDMSVKEGCHFCTLVWQTLDDGEGSLDLFLSAHRLRDVNPRYQRHGRASSMARIPYLGLSRQPQNLSSCTSLGFHSMNRPGSRFSTNLLETQFGRTMFTKISRSKRTGHKWYALD